MLALLIQLFGPIVAVQVASIFRGAIIAAIGAALTFVIHGLSGVDFGAWSVIATAILSILTNAVHQLNKTPTDTPAKPA